MCLDIIKINCYLDEQLEQDEKTLVEKHLETCDSCMKIFNSYKTSKKAIIQLNEYKPSESFLDNLLGEIEELEKSHISLEEISSYVDNELEESRFLEVKDHLEICEKCSLTYDSIRFQTITVGSLDEYKPSESFLDNLLGEIEELEKSHISLEEISSYVDNELEESRFLEVKDHLEICEKCSLTYENIRFQTITVGSLDEYKPSESFLDNLLGEIEELEKSHISLEEISSYVDNELEESRFLEVKDHLEICEKCDSQYKSLKVIRNTSLSLEHKDVPFDFSRRVLSEIEESEENNLNNNKIVSFFKYVAKPTHKAAMVAGIIVAGILATMSNPFMVEKTNSQITVRAEDFLFSSSTDYRTDSLEVVLSDYSEDDSLMIQDIGL